MRGEGRELGPAVTSRRGPGVCMKQAIVLLSGGLDSSTVLAIAVERGYSPIALTIDYGQRHIREIESAKAVARHYGIKDHLILSIDLGRNVSSALTTAGSEIPHPRSREEIGRTIPSTYVPSRNLIFLSIAASIAEARNAEAIFIAANSMDFSGYPDCTPEFMASFQKVLEVGTKAGKEGRPVRIEAPIISLSKADIIREAVRLRVPLELTWSCYAGGKKACGKCESCILRLEGFRKVGMRDPLEYEVIT